jgi:hypothetical protein
MGQELVRAIALGLGGEVTIDDAQPGLEVKIIFPADRGSPPQAIPPTGSP